MHACTHVAIPDNDVNLLGKLYIFHLTITSASPVTSPQHRYDLSVDDGDLVRQSVGLHNLLGLHRNRAEVNLQHTSAQKKSMIMER